jgi:hypothetical protein
MRDDEVTSARCSCQEYFPVKYKIENFESFENQGLSAFLPFRQSSGGNLQLIASSLRYRQRAEPAEPTSVIFRFISDMSS